jgi:hypothetical protein
MLMVLADHDGIMNPNSDIVKRSERLLWLKIDRSGALVRRDESRFRPCQFVTALP